MKNYHIRNSFFAKKTLTNTKRKSTTHIPKSHIYGPCTLSLSPPKGGTKRTLAVFASKIQLLWKKSLLQSFLCENFQQQSCSYIIPLSNGPQMDCG